MASNGSWCWLFAFLPIQKSNIRSFLDLGFLMGRLVAPDKDEINPAPVQINHFKMTSANANEVGDKANKCSKYRKLRTEKIRGRFKRNP